MKHIKVTLLLVAILTLVLTGCSTNDMQAYFDAMELTDQEVTGRNEIELYAELEFNEEGLDADELRNLSYFDVIHLRYQDKYDYSDSNELMAGHMYYNLGGLGLDMSIYMHDGMLYMKMPVQDMYMDMSSELGETESHELTEEQEMYMGVVTPFIEEWQNILRTDDIVKGEKTYVLTEEGQIKATTYEITIDEEQLKILTESMTDSLSSEGFIENNFTNNGESLTEEEIETVKEEFSEVFNQVLIESFIGTAFVDYDGRMVRQTFEFVLDFGDVSPGQLKRIDGSFTMEITELGEEQEFDFPEVSEDQWIDENTSDNVWSEMFPTE